MTRYLFTVIVLVFLPTAVLSQPDVDLKRIAVNWPTIERTDQFARQMGLYAKGKAGLFYWRVAAVRPFSTSVGAPTAIGNYNDSANTWGYSGYFQLPSWQFRGCPSSLPLGTLLRKKVVTVQPLTSP